jgi:hypothetical protein
MSRKKQGIFNQFQKIERKKQKQKQGIAVKLIFFVL